MDELVSCHHGTVPSHFSDGFSFCYLISAAEVIIDK